MRCIETKITFLGDMLIDEINRNMRCIETPINTLTIFGQIG